MKRFSAIVLAAAVALVGSLFAPKGAEAVPSFARQVGVPCVSCHFQSIPRLNAFGREFKLGGMTMASVDLIEDEGLSIPAVANMSFILKLRYRQDSYKNAHENLAGDKVGTERGVLDMPDEAAWWMAGRIADNWGFATENGDGVIKAVNSNDFGGFRGGVSFNMTDAHGISGSMELFNTGAVKNHRMFENRHATLAQDLMASNASGGALSERAPGFGPGTAIAFFGGNQMFFANIALGGSASSHDGITLDTGFGGLAQYFRVALTPAIGDGMDFMIGLQATSGTATLGNDDTTAAALTKLDHKFTAIDFQLQMADLGNGMSLEVNGAYAMAPKTDAGGNQNIYNSTAKDANAFHVNAGLGIGHYVLMAAIAQYDGGTSATKMNATSVGVVYEIRQNIVFHAEYSAWGGDGRSKDNNLLLMLELGV